MKSYDVIKQIFSVLLLACTSTFASADIWTEVEHGYAKNGDVKIHYATIGEGPLVIMIHGFPDFWYSWRDQMDGLKSDYKVVAIDQRGYNRSDQPEGEENYNMRLLVSDVAAVIRHFGKQSATIVGHDWGGAVSWQFAFAKPAMVDRLIILNLPHPNGLARERQRNKDQQDNTAYARKFITGSPDDPDIFFGRPMTAENLAGWVTDEAARKHYIEAFERSSFAAMLSYYKQNYGGGSDENSVRQLSPRLAMPVLIFHGLKDTALHSDALNNTWDWIDADTTIVTAPQASHFVQQDASELVTSTMKWWLLSRP
jgi:pimeloyl-ACP methyl ester carboxylesterase